MLNYTFHWRPAFNALPDMLWGALVSLQIAVLSMVIGVVLAVFLALGRQSSNKFLYGFSTGWVELARNTPAVFTWIPTWRFSLASPSTMQAI
jgi:polar amino acid transport system permease protein